MDPNTALETIREHVAAFNADEEVDVIEVMEAIESLDSWLVRGGFMPDAWARGYCPVANCVVSIPTDNICRECEWERGQMADAKIVKHAGIAGQVSYTVPSEGLTFVGSEVYGGPVVMIIASALAGGRPVQTFVTDPGRFGEFGKSWVERFIGSED